MADGAHGTQERAKFHAMTDGTAQDWMTIARASQGYAMELPERLVAHLKLLAGDCGGFAVDRLEHSLQTATRAHRDGRDEEYVVCALTWAAARRRRSRVSSAMLRGRPRRSQRSAAAFWLLLAGSSGSGDWTRM